MILKKFRPTSNSRRHKIALKKSDLTKNNKFIKNLVLGTKTFSGRSSNTGRITVRHKGGGTKRLYRLLSNNNLSFYAITIGVVFDPNRSIFIALNFNILKKSFFYNPAVNNIFPGAVTICAPESTEYKLGYRLSLQSIPVGSLINYVSLNYNSTAKYIKSAGTYGQLLQKSYSNCKIKLPSNKIIDMLPNSYATIGILSNFNYNKTVKGKAGANRLLGKRPSVRGIAMNPVDHPHGGRSNGGFVSLTPWGKITRGKKTAQKK